MRLTYPSPVYRGIFATFLAGSRQVLGKVLKQHQERRLQQFLLKRQIVMVRGFVLDEAMFMRKHLVMKSEIMFYWML
ncbi:hypothetical protein ERO13_A01G184600v2 [Gossypium hirsutum]|uniref:Uncharacterized protein n=3 Tax=Gossypium TaxID=3633 RepID=A0A5J5X2A8_GOSBA|nr:hypothetical protein ES319_A01G196400v1 [Gossypium barbadense]KAG4215555.1 hypothetical protein ERO13_A01G184600v2 [Gossypium hirsutum]TYH31951.1 hypothetical protein ES288_A01G212400v1 [Gossypium darwinii]KAG4215556.1 hypothetical protein ERO13_A01G184600v2 [Gossypium hirsutum]KAG4215557.1 hypothetical protein ERO13_A01G184600v2 [Gossypium hirsutum]